MIIRDATPADAGAIAAIWNHYIRHTTVTFTPDDKSEPEIAAMMSGPFFVAEDGGRVTGFARYFQFRSGRGYAFAQEHTVLLDPAERGRGAGRALMTRVIDHATAAGHHRLYAGVSGDNAAGIAFHARLGFETVATLPESGRKFDRWIDLVLMQKSL